MLKHPEKIICKSFRTYISLLEEIAKASHICTCSHSQDLIKIHLPESMNINLPFVPEHFVNPQYPSPTNALHLSCEYSRGDVRI